MKDECGVFGVFNHPEAGELCYLGLYALQHRGQESAGIVTQDGDEFKVVKDMGLVADVFDSENLDYLTGTQAIGHVRYSTTGSSHHSNIQPIYSKTTHGKVAIAHNGNLTNAVELYQDLKGDGALFQSTIDTEIMLHLIARSRQSEIRSVMTTVLNRVEGAFSLVGLGEGFMVAARDRNGFRPLVIGKKDDSYVISSETCALDLIGASYEGEVQPGELVIITDDGLERMIYAPNPAPRFCVFEHVYFARPDSVVYDQSVHLMRKEFGKQLAKEYPVEADMVMAIPDSGNSAALGYAEESGIPFDFGMTRNHYVGRTFIQPSQSVRNFGVRVKLNPVSAILKGKRVVVVDDSLVRGTTAKKRVLALKRAGAKEVHLRISSPPVKFPCHFGIDTPEQVQLIAANKSLDEIRDYVGADTLGFLTREGMLASIAAIKDEHFCTACFNGDYPIEVKDKGKFGLEHDKPIHHFSRKGR